MKYDLKGKVALVTGASSGLGKDFSRILAEAGCAVVLVARRTDALLELAEELNQKFNTITYTISLDLAQKEAPSLLKAKTDELGLNIDILINNAGFGVYGRFDEIDHEEEQKMIQLNISTLVGLSKMYTGQMKNSGWGRILQVASIGAFQPSPLYAAYSATKSFVLNYGIAIDNELSGTGVTCSVLSPGVTRTEFLDVAKQKITKFQKSTMMESEVVARMGIYGMIKSRKHIIPGFVNKIGELMARFISRGQSAKIAHSFVSQKS